MARRVSERVCPLDFVCDSSLVLCGCLDTPHHHPSHNSYFEVSCKTGLNVDVMFMHLFAKALAAL
jgi:hypothetical protein